MSNQEPANNVPPGLHANFPVHTQISLLSEHGASDWLPFEKVKLYTNAFIRCDGRVSACPSHLCVILCLALHMLTTVRATAVTWVQETRSREGFVGYIACLADSAWNC